MIDIQLEIQPFIGAMLMKTLRFLRCLDTRTYEEFKIYVHYMIGLLLMLGMRLLMRELRKDIAELRKIEKQQIEAAKKNKRV